MYESDKKVIGTQSTRRIKYKLREKGNSRYLQFISFFINNKSGYFE